MSLEVDLNPKNENEFWTVIKFTKNEYNDIFIIW